MRTAQLTRHMPAMRPEMTPPLSEKKALKKPPLSSSSRGASQAQTPRTSSQPQKQSPAEVVHGHVHWHPSPPCWRSSSRPGRESQRPAQVGPAISPAGREDDLSSWACDNSPPLRRPSWFMSASATSSSFVSSDSAGANRSSRRNGTMTQGRPVFGHGDTAERRLTSVHYLGFVPAARW